MTIRSCHRAGAGRIFGGDAAALLTDNNAVMAQTAGADYSGINAIHKYGIKCFKLIIDNPVAAAG